MIRVFLADDHKMFREGLKNILERDPGISFVGEADDGIDALKKISQLKPDIAVVDITMPGLNGIELTKQLIKLDKTIKVLILSMHSDTFFVINSFNAGARGYILKEDSFKLLIEAIRKVAKGNTFISPSVDSPLLQKELSSKAERKIFSWINLLTEREVQILQMIAEGNTNAQIADRLSISIRTVDTHRKNIMSKLNIHNVAGLVKYAIKHKIITV